MATAREVAALAGTSTAVVSYVFNNGPRNVAPETRDKVLRAAAELNYHPNALARALSFGKTRSIGLIVPDIANRFFGELARALEEAAAARGNLLLIGDSGLNPERERSHVAAFVQRRVDSVVMVSLADDPDLGEFVEADIPVIALHPLVTRDGASTISIDYRSAAAAATRHLVEHGYATIAMFNGPTDSAGSRQHREGFESVLAERPDVAATIYNSQISRGHAAQVALDILARPSRPRAIYCSTDEQAYGVLFACHRLGLRVPQDVAVTGFDGTEHSAYSYPPLTTIRQPIPEIAERVIQLLTSEPTKLPIHEIAPFELVIRESCGEHGEHGEQQSGPHRLPLPA